VWDVGPCEDADSPLIDVQTIETSPKLIFRATKDLATWEISGKLAKAGWHIATFLSVVDIAVG